MDATPQVEALLKDELEKVDRVYSAKGKDMTQFPTFNFTGHYSCIVDSCLQHFDLYS